MRGGPKMDDSINNRSSLHIALVNGSVVNISDHFLPPDPPLYSGRPHPDPMPLLIASSVAAVSILIFICLAYYCHALQLDSRARQLAIKLATGSAVPGRPMPCSYTSTSILSTAESDMSYQKRRNTIRTTSLTPSVPNSSRSLRGSMNWSAIADHELVSYSAPRRHSTFII